MDLVYGYDLAASRTFNTVALNTLTNIKNLQLYTPKMYLKTRVMAHDDFWQKHL